MPKQQASVGVIDSNGVDTTKTATLPNKTTTANTNTDTATDSSFTLGQKKYIKTQNTYFTRSSSQSVRFGRECNSKTSMTIDWNSFKPVLEDLRSRKLNTSVYTHCNFAISVMAAKCSDKDAKAVINKKVKSYVCHYGKKLNAKLEKGVFHFFVDFTSTNQVQKTEAMIDNML